MNELQVFNHPDFGNVRTVSIGGEPWFVGKDVAEALGYSNPRDALGKHVDEDDKNTVANRDGTSGNPNMTIINESGLYSLVLSSRLDSARRFKRWITGEVIPSIRRHGAYMTPQTIEQALLNPDTIIRLATRLKEEQEARKALEAKAAENAPKVLFADAVSSAKNSILIGEMAKLLKQNGVCIGQNRLFQWLREHGYLIRRKGADFNMPTQYSMERGLFEIKETAITKPDGCTLVSRTPKVTGKGQVFFTNLFLTESAS